jgi:hypothetical protein
MAAEDAMNIDGMAAGRRRTATRVGRERGGKGVLYSLDRYKGI